MEFFVTALICILLAAALFFSIRKLWRERGKSCCGGHCSGCCGCSSKNKKEPLP